MSEVNSVMVLVAEDLSENKRNSIEMKLVTIDKAVLSLVKAKEQLLCTQSTKLKS